MITHMPADPDNPRIRHYACPMSSPSPLSDDELDVINRFLKGIERIELS